MSAMGVSKLKVANYLLKTVPLLVIFGLYMFDTVLTHVLFNRSEFPNYQPIAWIGPLYYPSATYLAIITHLLAIGLSIYLMVYGIRSKKKFIAIAGLFWLIEGARDILYQFGIRFLTGWFTLYSSTNHEMIYIFNYTFITIIPMMIFFIIDAFQKEKQMMGIIEIICLCAGVAGCSLLYTYYWDYLGIIVLDPGPSNIIFAISMTFMFRLYLLVGGIHLLLFKETEKK